MQYRTIIIDPPWPEVGGGKIKRGADRHYPLMSIDEIKRLPIQTLSDENCHMYCWATDNYLADAMDILRYWKFKPMGLIHWIKSDAVQGKDWLDYQIRLNNPGLGQYIRRVTESCIFAVKGNLPYKTREDGKRAQIAPNVIFAPRREHSQKPEELRKMAELISHEPRLEMFARNRVDCWDCWGFDVSATIEIVNGVANKLLIYQQPQSKIDSLFG